MKYAEALAFIEQLNSKGIVLGLERMQQLLQLLGNPQKNLRCIHVAGTNGKGSVCAFLDSALQKAGLSVGRYISPTLFHYRERIQINREYIGEQELAELTEQVQSACRNMQQQNMELPTAFEAETAIAFLYFQKKQCDYVLLEAGMGGRLDSTNVIERPVLSVLTTIDLDHTKMLGNTLQEIAREKAGIIKQGCPAVIGPQKPEAETVLQSECKQKQSAFRQTQSAEITDVCWTEEEQGFSYREWRNVRIRLLGDYQIQNAATALDALWMLRQQEPMLTDEAILQGMEDAVWPGRFDIIHRAPLFVLDGAHNPAGAQALADTICKHFSGRRIHLIMGVFRDKDYYQIAKIMRSCGDSIICLRPPQERGLESSILALEVQDLYTTVIDAGTAAQAVQYAMERAEANDVILSFGSLSTIKDVQDAVRQWEVLHGTD